MESKKSLYLGNLVDLPVNKKIAPSTMLVIPDAKVGIEVELENWNRTNPPHGLWVRHDQEGSLRNSGIEFVTAGAGIQGEDILLAINSFCEHAQKNNWGVGYPRAAIHIHLDVTDLDVADGQLARLLSNYMLVEHIFFSFAGNWRKDCGFCIPYSSGQADFENIGEVLYTNITDSELFRHLTRNLSKYQALNLNAIPRFGTMEFRHLPTTFDSQRIISWINLILALKNSTINSPRLKDPLKALSDFGPEGIAREIFGPLYDRLNLGAFLDPAAMWEACDNCTQLMALGGKIKNEDRAPDAWDALIPENVNPLLLKKKKLISSKKRKAA